MKPGDNVLILPSADLKNLRLEKLAGITARVVEINGSFNEIKGCWVELPSSYLGEREWYIPYSSICI